jgi:exodeoxyribonuclease V alpha subunit
MKKLGLKSVDDDGAIIMVTRNDTAQGVVNGEIGVVADGRVYFSAGDDEVRSLALSELPDYELAYASTIHKAQGGEYDRVIIVIGKSEQDAFLSRELLYTAITRAKTSYEVYGSLEAIKALKPVQRASGLAARLR